MKRYLTTIWIILLGFALFFLIVSVNAAGVNDYTFIGTPIREALQIISARYEVSIIADPALSGLANGTIHSNDSVEEAIQTIIEPLGYNYSKVENYYLISGPKTSLTLFAETESYLIPVGFLSPSLRSKLSDYNLYLTFDETRGVVFIKAPTSIINKILTEIWKETDNASQISVLYNLKIVDLGTSEDLDALFSGSFDSAKGAEDQKLVVSPGALAVDSRISALIRDKITRRSDSLIRQPWLITIPGKTVQVTESLHYPGANGKLDRSFTVKLTPIKTDESSGKVLSEVYIGGDERRIVRVSSTIHSNPGSYELLAVVRQTEIVPVRTLLGRRKMENYRDFAVLLAATPVNVQTSLSATTGIVPIASLEGLTGLPHGEPAPPQPGPELGVGFVISESKPASPWFHASAPFGSQNVLWADYRGPGFYSLRLSSEFEPSGGTYLDFLFGKGVFPDGQTALMVGLGDRVRLTPFLTVFGLYYPNAYFVETGQFSGQGIWSAGASLENGKFGLSASASGDPDFNGWRVKIDLKDSKAFWSMEASTVGTNPAFYMGLGFRF